LWYKDARNLEKLNISHKISQSAQKMILIHENIAHKSSVLKYNILIGSTQLFTSNTRLFTSCTLSYIYLRGDIILRFLAKQTE